MLVQIERVDSSVSEARERGDTAESIVERAQRSWRAKTPLECTMIYEIPH
jgi:hypothetical protein